ncbi:MAG: cobalamin-dependent protein [Deltaproteobacteria bacterium]|nr:cobalamin-dependent protein [Deltaproteobacteria bacterium]
MKRLPHILLVNPWIYDFAAHDLWAKPLGLLTLGGLLRAHGYQVRLLDCLDVHEPKMREQAGFKPATRRSYGTGKFYRRKTAKPPPLRQVARPYYRFGISSEIFAERLLSGPEPDVVLVTSLMTYWYPGVQEAIRLVKSHYPETPVVLGGIYATLCQEHARRCSGADHVVAGAAENRLIALMQELTRQPAPLQQAARSPDSLPAMDLEAPLDYVCILTSRGCPYHCPYCGAGLLFPGFVQKNPLAVVDELQHWHEGFGVTDAAFYDDALLLNAEQHLLPMLAEVRRRKMQLRLHTPNALHVSQLSAKVCQALFNSGFVTIRLGLETAEARRQQLLGRKTTVRDFSRAMNNLQQAGFQPEQIGVYLLCGLPGQKPEEVAYSIDIVKDHGARPYLAEYSPIPGTALWPAAVRSSPFDLQNEPLYHNNSLLPCRSSHFGLDELQRLKERCRAA